MTTKILICREEVPVTTIIKYSLTYFVTTFLLLLVAGVQLSHAQEDSDLEEEVSTKITNTVVGIVGRDDKKSRSPVLTVSTENFDGFTQILIDASQRNSDYDEYPITFDIYINRSLFTKQIRSAELPGPLGVSIDHERTPLPFNYSVVAKVMTPYGDHFTTVLNGAVFPD